MNKKVSEKQINSESVALKSAIHRGNMPLFILTIINLIISSFLTLALAYIIQEVLDIAGGTSTKTLTDMIILFGCYIAVILLNEFILRETRNRYIQKAIRQYKEYAFSKLLKKNIRSFNTESTGLYISALTNDSTQIETNYINGTFNLIVQLLWFFGALIMMFLYDWKLTLVAIGLSFIPIIVSAIFGGQLVAQEKKVSDKNEGFVGMVKDLLSGFTVIRSFRAEPEIKKLFDKNNGSLESTKCKRRKSEDIITILSEVAGGCVQMGVFVFGAFLALEGEITVGVVIAFVQLMNFVLQPVQNVPKLLANRKAASALIDKLGEAISENISNSGTKTINGIGEGILFDKLTFGYTPDEPILKDITLKLDNGKSYAIVGASGSGKSTLLNLLLGCFDNYKGKIMLGNTELRDISSESLYDTLSIIQQNVFLFDSTIEENISMFKTFEADKLQAVIKKAGLSNLLEERGSDYRCGENGSALSGGEKQRISIARCLLRGTPVLLMDEATAALDAHTSFMVTEEILRIEGLTRIIITHKLEQALMEKYDEIIVLRDGSIIEQGNFDELMGSKGYFYSLYNITGEQS